MTKRRMTLVMCSVLLAVACEKTKPAPAATEHKEGDGHKHKEGDGHKHKEGDDKK